AKALRVREPVVTPPLEGEPGEDEDAERDVHPAQAMRPAPLDGAGRRPAFRLGLGAAQLLAEVALERHSGLGEELERKLAAAAGDDVVVFHTHRRVGGGQTSLVVEDLLYL